MKLLCIIICFVTSHIFALDLSQEELRSIGMRIWQNECRGTIEGLVSWNANEAFPSLGIGHFIWYPKDTNEPFEETFPTLLSELKASETCKLPYWLSHARHFPWKTREEFLKAKRSKKMNALRDILSETIDLQMQFIIQRFEESEQKILASLQAEAKETLSNKISILKQTPKGLFALIDYVNFKGTGLSPKERYRSHGWGLLQVLQNFPTELKKESAPAAFAASARSVLLQRVRNAPSGRSEERWLKGWNARLDRYK